MTKSRLTSNHGSREEAKKEREGHYCACSRPLVDKAHLWRLHECKRSAIAVGESEDEEHSKSHCHSSSIIGDEAHGHDHEGRNEEPPHEGDGK